MGEAALRRSPRTMVAPPRKVDGENHRRQGEQGEMSNSRGFNIISVAAAMAEDFASDGGKPIGSGMPIETASGTSTKLVVKNTRPGEPLYLGDYRDVSRSREPLVMVRGEHPLDRWEPDSVHVEYMPQGMSKRIEGSGTDGQADGARYQPSYGVGRSEGSADAPCGDTDLGMFTNRMNEFWQEIIELADGKESIEATSMDGIGLGAAYSSGRQVKCVVAPSNAQGDQTCQCFYTMEKCANGDYVIKDYRDAYNPEGIDPAYFEAADVDTFGVGSDGPSPREQYISHIFYANSPAYGLNTSEERAWKALRELVFLTF